MQVHVITWEYPDRSANGIVGIYSNFESATAELELLKEYCDGCRRFDLQSMELRQHTQEKA